MADFNFVTERLATGAAVTGPADVDALRLAGVTHVIDCRAEFDDGALLAGSGMAYLWNGVKDDGLPKPADWFARSLRFALPALAQPGHRVYAHCAAGLNRGPSTAYAIMRALGYGVTLARAEVLLHRPQCAAGLRYAADADRALASLGYC